MSSIFDTEDIGAKFDNDLFEELFGAKLREFESKIFIEINNLVNVNAALKSRIDYLESRLTELTHRKYTIHTSDLNTHVLENYGESWDPLVSVTHH